MDVRPGPSPELLHILHEEEVGAARVLNRFRYALILFLLIPITVRQALDHQIEAFRGSLLILVLFLGVTILHSIILRRRWERLIAPFHFITVTFDFGCVVYMPIYFTLTISSTNWGYLLKNPNLAFCFLVTAYTALQFRKALLYYAAGLFVVFYGLVTCYGLATHRLPRTADWNAYLHGDKVILFPIFTGGPIILIFLTAMLSSMISRAMGLVQKVSLREVEKASLARYFSPSIAQEILAKPGAIEKARRIRVTVLFCDIRGFTAMAERATPEELIAFLEDFRKRLTSAVFRHRGTIDKFIGDGIMAVFGLPEPASAGEDSRNAVRAAVGMFQGIAEMNRERELIGQPPIAIGIGIHAGEALVGNIDSGSTIEYSVIGDTVNTASRIESLCRPLGRSFLLSSTVFEDVRGMVDAELLPEQPLRGKEAPIALYSMSGAKLP